MASILAHIRLAVAALAVLIIAGMAVPQSATAQPVNPTADSVKEQQLLDEINRISGACSAPDENGCVLEQPGGRDWRFLKQVIMRLIGGAAILGMLAIVVGFYLVRGPVRLEHGRSGRLTKRFSAFERFVHWLATVCFIILALTGLNITFGKELLLPLIGPEAFTTLTRWGKYAHNFLSFPFTLSVAMMWAMWIAWNLPSRVDIQWMKEGGGFGAKHPPADLFNAGQKSIYWVVVLGGGLVAATGYVLMFPFFGTNILGMQAAQLVHGIVALLFIAAMIFHIYMGTVGEEGAFEGMWDGTVDENWAKQHHSIWYERRVGKGGTVKPVAEDNAQPAE